MKYCITESEKNEEFLTITRTQTYQFSDCDGEGSYSCQNHNLFLQMMEGALSGKTGFTAEAGYCYVGALRRDDRTFIVALLACGWPNNKGYKWSDTKKLMEYALENYEYRQIDVSLDAGTVRVRGGTDGGFPGAGEVLLKTETQAEPFRVLLRRDEDVSITYDLPETVAAPVQKGEELGGVICSLDGISLKTYPVTASKTIRERTFRVCLDHICGGIFLRY